MPNSAIRNTILLLSLSAFMALWLITEASVKPTPDTLTELLDDNATPPLLDRTGRPLSVTYQNRWNVHDAAPLHQIPRFLQQAFIAAEDKRFYRHHGIDWRARLHALYQNLVNLRNVRGASTLSEQVIKMLHPRPRTVWSRWLEGWEARELENKVGKQQILWFYLNQVPYAANRRGVIQAARYYFDRDLDTLNQKEVMALAVLVRAPSRLDLHKNNRALEKAVQRLAASLLNPDEQARLSQQGFELQRPELDIEASHFVRYVRARLPQTHRRLQTTLDGNLQTDLQGLLDHRLILLANRRVNNAALLVADHSRSEILAWVIAGAGQDRPGAKIDSVTTLRQPGSALKPFLYALALEKGWSPATLINDAPLSEAVGAGLHRYQNYSRTFYGPVSLRDALGNSLNIPALRTIQFVGAEHYLAHLHAQGFDGLTRHPNVYGDGLALGNAEVTLLQLVQAYSALAHRGLWRPLRVTSDPLNTGKRLFSAEAASLIGNILSDPGARRLEFGTASVLNLPQQTAVKTGTSSDFRDSWAVGYNDRYVVGVWMGNLDNTSTDGLTGSTGPGLVLRSVFSKLNRHRESKPLYLSPNLIRQTVCKETGLPPLEDAPCIASREEWFMIPPTPPSAATPQAPSTIRLRQPTDGLHLAIDPRLPREKQGFEFLLQGVDDDDRVEWSVDGRRIAIATGARYFWPLRRGEHSVSAVIRRDGRLIRHTESVDFQVK